MPTVERTFSLPSNSDDADGEPPAWDRKDNGYVIRVTAHSERSMQNSLYTGVNYRGFVKFLQDRQRTRSNLTQFEDRPYVFATIHELGCAVEDPQRVNLYDGIYELNKFDQRLVSTSKFGRLIFLKGYPSPDWVKLLGARYRIDPEFFRRQVTLGSMTEYFEIPSLPSSSLNIIELTITSVGRCNVSTASRQEAAYATRKHFQALGENSRIGESIVRKFNRHDEAHFSIEQRIALCLVMRGDSWIVIICDDSGKDLQEGPLGPWFDDRIRQLDDIFLPVIFPKPRIAISRPSAGEGNLDDAASFSNHIAVLPSKSSQTGAHLGGDQYGQFIDPDLMAVDPFYACHDVFAFSAASECQFLNLVKAKLDLEDQRPFVHDEDMIIRSLSNFKYHKALLEDHMKTIDSTLAVIKGHITGSGGNWPLAQERDKQAKALLAAKSLERDYTFLAQYANGLRKRCKEGTDNISNNAILAESKKAIVQAKSVARLTLLAFFFIPLSFVTSFFGMNFVELGTGKLSIWVWFAVSFPVFGIALLVCFWDSVEALGERLRRPFM